MLELEVFPSEKNENHVNVLDANDPVLICMN